MIHMQKKRLMNDSPVRFVGVLLFALTMCMVPHFAMADTIDGLYQEASREYRAAIAVPQKEQKAQAIRVCLQHLQELLEADMGEKYADKTYYLIAQCHHTLHDLYSNSTDLNAALEKYRSVISRYPQSPLADDALYLRGILLQTLDPAAARLEFQKVVILYPNGDMRAKAALKAKELAPKPGYSMIKKKPGESEGLTGRNKVKLPAQERKETAAADGGASPGINLTDIKHWTGPDYTRVALYTNAPVGFKETAIAADPGKGRSGKIYIDLEGCLAQPGLKTKISIMDGFLQDIRTEVKNARGTRIILNIEAIDSYRVFSLEDPFRVIIDVRGKTSQESSIAQAPPSLPAKSSLPSLARQLALDVERIVLDPGHGGKDTGAISPRGVYEKDITLSIAKSLKGVLEKATGCEVILTRTQDKFLSLEERTAIANTHKADLFISIHTNAHEDRNLFGTETYFLNLAKDKESARVAAFENATSTKKVSDLETILHELMLNTKLNESAQLARQVQNHVIKDLKVNYEGIRDLGTKQAPFYVLLGAEMPSILIETAFITNKREEHRLRDKQFQENLAKAISSGVQSYIQQMKGLARAGEHS